MRKPAIRHRRPIHPDPATAAAHGPRHRLKPRLVALTLWLMTIASSAVAQTLYVDAAATGANNGSNWANAFNNLRDALDAAASASEANPCEILVARGTYKPDLGAAVTTGDRAATFTLQNHVSLLGGYAGAAAPDPNARDIRANTTILSGDLAGDDTQASAAIEHYSQTTRRENSYSVLTATAVDASAVLDGFTVTAGHSTDVTGWGAGLFNTTDASPTVSNCIFIDNAAYGGGAIANLRANPQISDCTFIRNLGGIGGGAVYNFECSSPITDCAFLGNVALWNRGGGALVGWSHSDNTIVNCLFSGNFAHFNGGAVATLGTSSPQLINCSFTNNTARDQGGGLYCTVSDSITVANCIFHGNTDASGAGETAQIHKDSAVAAVSYTCIAGLSAFAGNGNIDADPLFADADGADNVPGTADDNLRLLPGSPCIDAADNNALPGSVLTDLDDQPRLRDDPATPDTGNPPTTAEIADMGPFEGPSQAFIIDNQLVSVPEGDVAHVTLRLARDPLTPLTATLQIDSGDDHISLVSPTSLDFDSTNFDQPRTITLAAAEDSDNLNGSTHLSISAASLPPAGVTAVEADNEPWPDTIFVDDEASGAGDGTTFTDALNSLQDALTLARSLRGPVEIRIAAGTYTPGADRSSTFALLNGVDIKGGYAGASDPDARDLEAHRTILSGDLQGDDSIPSDPAALPDEPTRDDNCYHVITASFVDNTARLDGCTITAGNADGQSADRDGGGMFNDEGDPTITNCLFTENTARSRGGAIVTSSSKHPVLTGCTFNANVALYGGGALCQILGYISLIDCRFTSNMTLDTASGTGGAVRNEWSSYALLKNCIFAGNSTTGAGGALFAYDSSVTELHNCTFNANKADSGGAIAGRDGAITVLRNCILWANDAPTGPQISQDFNCDIAVLYCDLQAGSEDVALDGSYLAWGDGNIDADPLFAEPGQWTGPGDWTDGDYHLMSTAGRFDPDTGDWTTDALHSPCIDAGDPQSDFSQELWPHGRRTNMGAYGASMQASLSTSAAGEPADCTGDGLVNEADLKMITEKWLAEGPLMIEDLDRNRIVDFLDLAILVGSWQ